MTNKMKKLLENLGTIQEIKRLKNGLIEFQMTDGSINQVILAVEGVGGLDWLATKWEFPPIELGDEEDEEDDTDEFAVNKKLLKFHVLSTSQQRFLERAERCWLEQGAKRVRW